MTGAGPVLGDHLGAPGPAGHLHRSVSQDLTERSLLVEREFGFPVGPLHLRRGVPEGAVEHRVGLVVQLQHRPPQPVSGTRADDLAPAALTFHGGQTLVAGIVEVAGPVGHPVQEGIGGKLGRPADDLGLLVEEVVAMGAVGVVGQDPGVIEPDPAIGPRHPRLGQGGELAGDMGPGAGGGPGDTGVLAQPGRGVPEVVPAPGPQPLDLHEKFGFLGVEPIPARLQPAGSVSKGGGILNEHVLRVTEDGVLTGSIRWEHQFDCSPGV